LENLNGYLTVWIRDRNFIDFDRSNFWGGTGTDGEGVFGSVVVVLFVRYLVCSKIGSCFGGSARGEGAI
jgi:hypothetical protein